MRDRSPNTEPRLFIGGPADGERRLVRHGHEVRIHRPDPDDWVGAEKARDAEAEFDRYLGHDLGGYDKGNVVFIHDSLTTRDEVLALLIANYRPEKVEVAPPAPAAPPPPPRPAGGEKNAHREGWRAYFAGRDREACPFPPGRRELQRGYREGWDAAKASTDAIDPA